MTTLEELDTLEESFTTYRSFPGDERSGEPAKRYVQEPLQEFFGGNLPPGLRCGPGDRPPDLGRKRRDELDIAIDDAAKPWRFRTRYIASDEPVRVHIEVASYASWAEAKVRQDLDALHRSIDEAAACGEKCWTGIVLAGGEWVRASEKIAPLFHHYYHERQLSRRFGIGAPYPYSWPYVDAVVLPGMYFKKHDLIEQDEHGRLPATDEIVHWPHVWPVMMPYPLSTQGNRADLRPLAVVRSLLRKYLSNVTEKRLDTSVWTSSAEEREVCGPVLTPYEASLWRERYSVVCLQDHAPGMLYHWVGEHWLPFVRDGASQCTTGPYMFGPSRLDVTRRTT